MVLDAWPATRLRALIVCAGTRTAPERPC